MMKIEMMKIEIVFIVFLLLMFVPWGFIPWYFSIPISIYSFLSIIGLVIKYNKLTDKD